MYYIDKNGEKVELGEVKSIDFTEEELKYLNTNNFTHYCEFYELDRLERYSRYLIYTTLHQ